MSVTTVGAVVSRPDPEVRPSRRDIKAIRNLQESRHGLARRVFHGRNGALRHAYQEGMEDQLGVLRGFRTVGYAASGVWNSWNASSGVRYPSPECSLR